MLVAGASAGDTSSWGGALTFIAYDPPSSAWWSYGSAEKTYRSILFLV